MKHLSILFTLCLIAGCESHYYGTPYNSTLAPYYQPDGFTLHVGREPVLMISDGSGGYIGDIGGEPLMILPDGAGGFIGDIGGEPFLMLSDGAGGYLGDIGGEPFMILPDGF